MDEFTDILPKVSGFKTYDVPASKTVLCERICSAQLVLLLIITSLTYTAHYM